MEKFIYTNTRGKSVTFDYSGDYLIDSYDGLTSTDIEPVTIKGYNQNGYTLGGLTLGARHINFNFLMRANTIDGLYTKRRELAEVFNPLLGEGTLTYENNILSKSIKCVATVLPTPTEKMGLMSLMNVELTANNPFWFDSKESLLILQGKLGGLTFPLRFNKNEIFAYSGSTQDIEIKGDIPSPIRAEFSNAAYKPRLTLSNTGEFIEVDTILENKEKLIITTEYGNKNVLLHKNSGEEETAYHLITLDSSFFSLPIGPNHLEFSSETGEPEVKIYYRNYYVGV